jgi:hypothetical protein
MLVYIKVAVFVKRRHMSQRTSRGSRRNQFLEGSYWSQLNDVCRIKNYWGFENYLLAMSQAQRIILCKFRCTINHKLPIQLGRYNNTPREERICTKCNLEPIGDEIHHVLICPFYANLRENYIPIQFRTHPNIFKYMSLLNSPPNILRKLSIFLSKSLPLL